MGEFVAVADYSVATSRGDELAGWYGAVRALFSRLTPVTAGAESIADSGLEDRSATFGIEAGLQELDNLYSVADRPRVHGFLRRHQWLVRPLLAIYDELLRHVDVRGPIILEYVADPEEDFSCLCVTVLTNATPDEAVDLLDRFDDWWLEQPARFGELIIVTVAPE